MMHMRTVSNLVGRGYPSASRLSVKDDGGLNVSAGCPKFIVSRPTTKRSEEKASPAIESSTVAVINGNGSPTVSFGVGEGFSTTGALRSTVNWQVIGLESGVLKLSWQVVSSKFTRSPFAHCVGGVYSNVVSLIVLRFEMLKFRPFITNLNEERSTPFPSESVNLMDCVAHDVIIPDGGDTRFAIGPCALM